MKKKILFIYTNYSTFVKTDYEILSSKYDVVKYQFKPVKGIYKTTTQLIKQFFYLLVNIWKYDSVFVWFADHHTLLPVLFSQIFKKKSFVVIGGYDAVAIPELKYGLFKANSFRQLFGRLAIKYASFLLPVDKSLIKSTNYYATNTSEGLPVGVENFVKGIKGKIITIPTGYNSNAWKEQPEIQRRNSVITVGYIPDWLRWNLKGCDLICELARDLNNVDFFIYGISDDFLYQLKNRISIPSNLFLLHKVKSDELPKIYTKHKVYAQFSLSEGFPNVLCESILCGCVPIGSNVNGIPTIIINKQLILSSKNLSDAKRIVQTAMNLPQKKIKEQYNYITKKFTVENRKKILLDLFNGQKKS